MLRAMQDDSKELWLFTMRFPYGTGEAFIESELPILLKHFRKVTLFPMLADAPMRDLPANVCVNVPVKDLFRSASLVECSRYARRLWQLIGSDFRRSLRHPSKFRERLALARQLLHRMIVLEKEVFKNFRSNNTLIYSYWTSEWATVLGLVKYGRKHLQIFSRIHGFDLYEKEGGSFPFREFQLQQIDRIFAVSDFGLNHLRQRHPAIASKVELAPLGTADHGMGPIPADPIPTVVSCSSLIPLKRVDLIVRVLSIYPSPLRWIHFGSGEMFDRIQAMLPDLPQHIHVELKGNVPNTGLMNWYQQHSVDVMIHLSRMEGLPVALQEAASFGIPMLATDAGGVKEIVNEQTGTLLPNDPDPAAISLELQRLLQRSRSVAFREGVRDFWLRHFNAAYNHDRFARRLLQLHEHNLG